MRKRLEVTAANVASRLLHGTVALIPVAILRRIVARLIGDDEIALCLHRVGPTGLASQTLMPELCHDPGDIDAILDVFRRIESRLTMAFDDGYADAAEYVLDRAPRHPEVDWRFMLCPQKTIDRRGFPWDDWIADERVGDVDDFLLDWQAAHDSDPARAAGSVGGAEREPFRLATIEECRELALLDNVRLGNHSDRHLPSVWLKGDELADEIRMSNERFVGAFGAVTDFAFPFGTMPWVSPDDVRIALDTVEGDVWTIGSRAVVSDPRVRPRFSMRSTDGSPKGVVLVIAVRCFLARRRRRSTESVRRGEAVPNRPHRLESVRDPRPLADLVPEPTPGPASGPAHR